MGIRLVTIFLTNEEYSAIRVKRNAGNQHCKSSKFVWTTYNSENQSSGRAQSRGDNSKRKEMEIIPEKSETLSMSERDKGYLSDTSVESRKSKNNIRKSSNLWTPADHPTQITQGFESPSQQMPNVEQDVDVTISDLDNDSPRRSSEVLFKEEESKNNQDCVQHNVLNNISCSSNESMTHNDRNDMSSEVTVLAEVHQIVNSQETNGIQEVVQTESAANRCEIEIRVENLDVEDTEKVSEENPPNVTVLNVMNRLPLARTPEILSDIETVDSRLSGSESPEIHTAAESNSSADQVKERLEFTAVSSGVGVSGDEMSDNNVLEERVPTSSVNSSIPSSKYSSFLSSKFDSLTSESTVLEEGAWYPGLDDLQDAILYIQGHSEISLLLLLEGTKVPDHNTIQSLVKS